MLPVLLLALRIVTLPEFWVRLPLDPFPIMTELPYREEYSEDYVREMLLALAKIGTKTPILTGVSLSEGKTGAMGYDAETGTFFSYQNDRVPAAYHGTGDIFSSVLAGAFVLGLDRAEALKIAADYTAQTIAETLKNPGNPWYGVDFEATIPSLVDALRQIRKKNTVIGGE